MELRISNNAKVNNRERTAMSQHDAGGAHQDDAHAQHVFEFRVVPRAVVEADDRRAADGIADIDGNEDKLDVHQNAVGRYAVLAEVFEQLEVIDHAHRWLRRHHQLVPAHHPFPVQDQGSVRLQGTGIPLLQVRRSGRGYGNGSQQGCCPQGYADLRRLIRCMIS